MNAKAAPDRILIVCDDANMQALFGGLGTAGDLVVCTRSGAEALRRLEQERFDLLIVDVDMAGMHKGEFFAKARTLRPMMRRLAFKGSDTVDAASLATLQRADDGLTMPPHPEGPSGVRETPLDGCRHARNGEHLPGQVERKGGVVHMVGESAPMQRLFHLVKRVADSQSTVLIQGETGTGKELIARAIHQHSPRHAHAFVAIDCGAVSESLLESELFGHEKGAFTGAISERRGLFQEAHQGTLLLDEIGNTTLAFQAKLLRVLQEGEVRPVGGHKSVKVDVRVIASTNKDLRKAVEEKTFRQDLYFRLAVVPLVTPPLRQRREDIPLLVEHFLEKFCTRDGLAPKRVSPEALEILVNAPWPGNVRELEHVVERAVVLSGGETIEGEDLALPTSEVTQPLADGSPALSRLEAAEREVLLQAILEHGGDKRAAAQALGIGLSTLYGKLARLRMYQLYPTLLSGSSRLPA